MAVPLAVLAVTGVQVSNRERDERAYERLGLTVDAGLAQLAQVRAELDASAARAAASRVTLDFVLADDPTARAVLEPIRLAEGIDALVVVRADGTFLGWTVADGRRVPSLDAGAITVGKAGPWLVARADIVEAGAGVRGEVIAVERLDPSLVQAMARPAGTTLELAARTRSEGRASETVAGTERLAVRRNVPGTTASLVAATPIASVAGERRGLVVGAAALLLAVLGSLVAIGWFVGGVVTRPVREVARAANDVASGDYGRQVEVGGDREIVQLATAFNAMTEHLRKAMDELARRQEGFNAALGRLGDALAASHDLPRILDVVLEASVDALRGRSAAFFCIESPPATLNATAVLGPDVSHGVIVDGIGIAGTAARTARPAVWPALTDVDGSVARPEPPEPAGRTAVGVPVQVRGRPYGVLAVYGRDQPFVLADVETLQTLARQAEVAIENIELHEEAQRYAVTDGLTGLWNRRQFDTRLREEMQRAERFGEGFALVLVDVDHFKAVNDRYDHSVGDAALVFIADRLREAVREIDVVARWGGEEFAVLLPHTGVEEATLVAERIRALVAERPLLADGHELALTVSAGVAAHGRSMQTVASLFRAADDALYRAKDGGRNRVERASAADAPGGQP